MCRYMCHAVIKGEVCAVYIWIALCLDNVSDNMEMMGYIEYEVYAYEIKENVDGFLAHDDYRRLSVRFPYLDLFLS